MLLNRTISSHLESWRTQRDRRPLLVRGARQVGKSHIIKEFGLRHFSHIAEVNFEFDPELKTIFESTLDPTTILRTLAIRLNVPIEVGTTLVFFDEIQACPKAITALRYFYEKLPALHVIAAGSLLEFTLESEQISMPVGRIQSLFLNPLSFREFLSAQKEDLLLDFMMNDVDISKPIDDSIHKKGMSLVKEYAVIGGMPQAVATYTPEPQALGYRSVQQGLLQTFRDDFGKYARSVKYPYLERVFISAPALISRDYKYSHVDRETSSRSLKEALSLLERAGIVSRIRATSGAGLPLEAYADDRRFKIAFLDIGLAQAAMGLDAKIALQEDFIAINAGAIAEQFVAQELIVNASPSEPARLYYWTRNKPNSTAEVDFLYQHNSEIFPIEVKAGATGRLKSLRSFLSTYNTPFGIRISGQNLGFHDQVLTIPFYLLAELSRLVEQVKLRCLC